MTRGASHLFLVVVLSALASLRSGRALDFHLAGTAFLHCCHSRLTAPIRDHGINEIVIASDIEPSRRLVEVLWLRRRLQVHQRIESS